MSELHNRLSHLVNYSSQLIFVSGDSVADQQRTLSEFIASQQENTEISFFAANNDKSAIDYRSLICRQLGGHTVGSFIRPLQQLLKDQSTGLRAINGPYLVCITQAEMLADSFLQELWDWVMHAQTGEEKLHINIILFGEANWAKRSQEYLPSENSHEPVLLSSQSVDPVGFDVNALEALMADKGSWLSTSNQPMVTNKWFIGSVLGLFLMTFVGLMTWQYPHLIESLSDTEQASTLNAEIDDFDVNDAVSINALSIKTVPTSNTELDDKPSVMASIEDDEVISNDKTPNTSVTESLLVQTWNSENKDLPRSTQNEPQKDTEAIIAANDASQSLRNEIDQQQDSPQKTVSPKIASPKVATPKTEIGTDFQVPDIISVEQLNNQLNQQEAVRSIEYAEVLDINNTPEPPLGETSVDYQFDETTLLSLPTDAIVLQLSGIQNPVVLENYLNSNDLKASTWVYQTQRYGGPWYVVVYKQAFASIDAALQQKSKLPINQRETQAFAKSIDQIQEEISRR